MRNTNFRRAVAASARKNARNTNGHEPSLKGFSRKAHTPRYKAIAEFTWDDVPVLVADRDEDSFTPSPRDRQALASFLDLS